MQFRLAKPQVKVTKARFLQAKTATHLEVAAFGLLCQLLTAVPPTAANRRLPYEPVVRPRKFRSLLYFMVKCKAMTEATLSAKNQIVIPREAREALGLKPGDKILVVVRGEKVLVLQRPKSHRVAMRGMARGIYAADHVQKERRVWR